MIQHRGTLMSVDSIPRTVPAVGFFFEKWLSNDFWFNDFSMWERRFYLEFEKQSKYYNNEGASDECYQLC